MTSSTQPFLMTLNQYFSLTASKSFPKCPPEKGSLLLLCACMLCAFFLFLPLYASAETYVSGNITQNTTWTAAGSPYIVTGDVTVRHTQWRGATATLTIEPGVEIRFTTGTGLFIARNNYHGALVAQGTADAPIRFTSHAASPQQGDWRGLYFQNYTNDQISVLDRCIVEYGGASQDANLYFHVSSPTITNTEIRGSSGHGIYLASAAPTIQANVIRENAKTGIYSDDGARAVIAANDFLNNGDSAVNVHPTSVHRVGSNTGSGNGADYIHIRGGEILVSRTWKPLPPDALPYVIMGDVTVRHSAWRSSTATLTLNPGVELRFATGKGLFIARNNYHGALVAQGTADAPIRFTSHADELGGELTSLIEEIKTHFLIHDVLVDIPGRDHIVDFLATPHNDPDENQYVAYESDNLDTEVIDLSNVSQLAGEGELFTITTEERPSSLIYTTFYDPTWGKKNLTEVYRSDGKYLPSENFWISKSRNGNLQWEYFLHLFDEHVSLTPDSGDSAALHDSVGETFKNNARIIRVQATNPPVPEGKVIYTLVFESDPSVPQPPVFDVLIPEQSVKEGETLTFFIETSDPNGSIPILSASPLPVGATFQDQTEASLRLPFNSVRTFYEQHESREIYT